MGQSGCVEWHAKRAMRVRRERGALTGTQRSKSGQVNSSPLAPFARGLSSAQRMWTLWVTSTEHESHVALIPLSTVGAATVISAVSRLRDHKHVSMSGPGN